MALHVSIHDVSPAWADEFESALAICHAAGVRPALLVVPDFHGRAPLDRDPAFCARLRGLQAEGHEIYLHGLRHRSEAGARGQGRLARFVSQRVVSANEAELAGLSRGQGEALVDDGERVLRSAGLEVDGFVAPAWAMPRWLLPLLVARRYRFTEDHTRVYDPELGQSRVTVLFNWASRSPGRLLASAAWCRLAKVARAALPGRIAVHPGDMRHLLLRREVARFLEWGRGDFVNRGRDLLV